MQILETYTNKVNWQSYSLVWSFKVGDDWAFLFFKWKEAGSYQKNKALLEWQMNFLSHNSNGTTMTDTMWFQQKVVTEHTARTFMGCRLYTLSSKGMWFYIMQMSLGPLARQISRYVISFNSVFFNQGSTSTNLVTFRSQRNQFKTKLHQLWLICLRGCIPNTDSNNAKSKKEGIQQTLSFKS